MSEIIYRDATVSDIPKMLDLWRQFWSPQPYEANLKQKIERDPDLVLVAECEGLIVGTIIGGYDNWWAWVYRVAVSREYQKRGIGTRLFREIHQRLAARGADGACMITSLENEEMCRLLRTVGYKQKEYRMFSFVF